MGPPSYTRSVIDGNVVVRRIPVQNVWRDPVGNLFYTLSQYSNLMPRG